MEGGERSGPLQVGLDMIVLLVQAPEDLENKGTVLHMLVEVTEVVNHPLHPMAVVFNAQIALHEELKLCVEVEGACLTVAKELLLEGNLKLLSGAAAAASVLLEVGVDGAEKPRHDHVVHPTPMGVIEGRSVGGDMVVEGDVLEHQQHEVTLTRVSGGRDAKDDRHQGPDVLDVDSLSVEVADRGSLECTIYVGYLPWCHRWC
jgi:hypothetical protein